MSSCKGLVISVKFAKYTLVLNFMKIRPVGAKLFRAEDTQTLTDMAMLIVTFRNFAKAPKKVELPHSTTRKQWSASRPGLFTSVKEPWYALNRRWDRLQCRSGLSGEGKNLLSLPRFEPRSLQPVARSLYRLLYCWVTARNYTVLDTPGLQ